LVAQASDVWVVGYPTFSAGPTKHLFHHPGLDQWHLHRWPFDRAVTVCWAYIRAASGPVPTGAQAWTVLLGGEWVEAKVTAREAA
jgi:hypothetical protein